MPGLLKNIIRYLVTGFLLFAISGLTITVHHEHSIGNTGAQHEHRQPGGLVFKTTPKTYHEGHLIKLLSGDSFSGSQKLECKNSPIKLLTLQLDLRERSSKHHSTSLANIDIRDTGPPSRDRCVLFCSFLVWSSSFIVDKYWSFFFVFYFLINNWVSWLQRRFCFAARPGREPHQGFHKSRKV